MAVAELADVEALLMRALTVAEQPFVDRLLLMAQPIAERYCGRRFDPVDGDDVVVGQAGDTVLYLPSPPVIDLTSVTVRGAVVPPAWYEWSTSGRLASLVGWWTGPATVVYSHGFAEGHPDRPAIAAGVASIVVDAITGPATPGVKSESRSIDDFSRTVTFDGAARRLRVGDGPAGLLDPFRLPVSSVPIETDDTLALAWVYP